MYKRDLSYSDLEEAYGGNKMLSLCVVFRFDHYKNICKENAEKIPNYSLKYSLLVHINRCMICLSGLVRYFSFI